MQTPCLYQTPCIFPKQKMPVDQTGLTEGRRNNERCSVNELLNLFQVSSSNCHTTFRLVKHSCSLFPVLSTIDDIFIKRRPHDETDTGWRLLPLVLRVVRFAEQDTLGPDGCPSPDLRRLLPANGGQQPLPFPGESRRDKAGNVNACPLTASYRRGVRPDLYESGMRRTPPGF